MLFIGNERPYLTSLPCYFIEVDTYALSEMKPSLIVETFIFSKKKNSSGTTSKLWSLGDILKYFSYSLSLSRNYILWVP